MPKRAGYALAGAGAAVALLFVTWFLAFHVGVFERADQKVLTGFAGLNRPRVSPILNAIADLCNPQPFALFGAVLVLVAVVRRRPKLAVAIAAALIGANVTTQLLKPLLAHARVATVPGAPRISAASWPSGHATAAMSLALAAALVAPARVRPYIAALGALFAIAVSYSFLALKWHYPSDVFGGFLVAGAWALLVVGALFATDRTVATARERRRPASTRRVTVRDALTPLGFALAGAVGLAGLVVLARPQQVVAYARVHTAFMIGAPAIAALALAVAAWVVLVVRRSG
jgi:membrane-associated phospholipid phosphatase